MNLKHIEAFREVMVTGSMSRAAKTLFTSQPNISRLIAQLERDTGLQLFQRSGVRLIPTNEGMAFFREVERAFVGLSTLASAAAQIRDLGNGRLRIAAIPAVGLSLVPEAIRRFQPRFPGVTVSLHMNNSGTVNHWTASRFCDIGVAVRLGDSEQCDVELLSEVPAVCVLPAGHRLLAKKIIKPADLAGEPYISLCHGDGRRAQIDEVFQRAGVDRVMAIEAQYGAICCQLVLAGMGVTVTHPIVARDFVEKGVEIRRFSPDVPYPTHLLFPTGPRDRLAEAFAGVVREVHDEMMEDTVGSPRRKRRPETAPPSDGGRHPVRASEG